MASYIIYIHRLWGATGKFPHKGHLTELVNVGQHVVPPNSPKFGQLHTTIDATSNQDALDAEFTNLPELFFHLFLWCL